MPGWAVGVISTAAVVTAVSVLWSKVIRPVAKLIKLASEMLPLLRIWTAEFQGQAGSAAVLNEIVKQFRTDSGSSLRDVVNRLEVAAEDNRQAADRVRVGMETNRLLADQDREQVRRLLIMLDRLTISVASGGATGLRIEAAAAVVADDLAASHQRAAEIPAGDEAGAAADAASRGPE